MSDKGKMTPFKIVRADGQAGWFIPGDCLPELIEAAREVLAGWQIKPLAESMNKLACILARIEGSEV